MNKDDMQIIPANDEHANETQITAMESRKSFVDTFRIYYKLGVMFSQSNLVPENYKNRPYDCTIAIDMAERMGVTPLMVMQSLYIVKGKPSWSGQACMTFIRNKYENAMPVYVGDQGTDNRGCYIKAYQNGQEVIGTTVTLKMAKSEGWTKNQKWLNMTDQMLAYRAAAFFARVYCPECLMGVYVEGEPEDIDASRKSGGK